MAEDLSGIIALERRYPFLWHPWGMTSEIVKDILKANEQPQTGVSFSEEERSHLKKLTCEWDPLLVQELLVGGRKVYREMLMPVLLDEYWLNGGEN